MQALPSSLGTLASLAMKLRYLLCGWVLAISAGLNGQPAHAQWYKALTQGWGSSKGDEEAPAARGGAAQNARFPQRTKVNVQSDMHDLRDRINAVVADYYSRPLNSRDNDSWEVMHTIIPFGVDAEIRSGGPQGQRRNAIGHLCYNYPLRGPRMLTIKDNLPFASIGVGLQGHQAQFLAVLAQSRLSRNYPLLIQGRKFTVEDLIKAEQLNCRTGTELTFTLISMAHYLPTDATWSCSQGQTWDIARLIREEIRQPITHSAACGGTHRLMGLSYAVRRRQQQGKPIDGEFARAQEYLDNYFDWTLSLQNPDGSFSTSWLVRRENRPDIDRKLQCTGHITEWLVYALPKQRLRDEQIVAAVDFLTSALEMNRGRDWKVGPLGHALHALVLYHQRVFESKEDEPGERQLQTEPEVEQPLPQAEVKVDVASKDRPAKPADVSRAAPPAFSNLRKPAAAETRPTPAPGEPTPATPEPTPADSSLPAIVHVRKPTIAIPENAGSSRSPIGDPEDPPLTVIEVGERPRPSEPSEPADSPIDLGPVAAPDINDPLDVQLFRVIQNPHYKAAPPEEVVPAPMPEPAPLPLEPQLLQTPRADELPLREKPAPRMRPADSDAAPADSDELGMGSAAGVSAGLFRWTRLGVDRQGDAGPLSDGTTKPPVHVGLRPHVGSGPVLVAPH